MYPRGGVTRSVSPPWSERSDRSMNQDELLREHIALLRQQNRVLLNMATHTRLLYILSWISLVVGVVIAAVLAGDSDGGAALGVLVVGALVIAAIAKGAKNVETIAWVPESSTMAEEEG